MQGQRGDRAAWSEAERLVNAIHDILEEEALYDDFMAEPVEAHIERLRTELAWRRRPPTMPRLARAVGEAPLKT